MNKVFCLDNNSISNINSISLILTDNKVTYTIDNNGSQKEEITNNNVKNINKIELFFT